MKRLTVITISLFVALSIGLSISSAAQYDPEVYQAQKALKARGYYPGKPDGLWGKFTVSAIKQFQVDTGLPVTGKLDEQTKVKLGIGATLRSAIRIQPTKERRLALVIGNSAYRIAPLKNPVNDAKDMAAALRGVGFEVMHKQNAGQRVMEESIRNFGTKLRKGGVGLFYYAGHGMQIGGRNYLIPTDAEVYKETDVKYESVDAGRILDEMNDAKNGLNIVILDACRDNPFSRSFRTTSRGLARMDAPTGTFIAYATGPGSIAADGEGRNGIFTKHLLKNIAIPGLKIEDVMKEVRIGVMEEIRNKQVPWQASSLTGNFYFASNTTPAIQSSIQFADEKANLEKERQELERLKLEIERKRLEAERKRLEEEQKKNITVASIENTSYPLVGVWKAATYETNSGERGSYSEPNYVTISFDGTRYTVSVVKDGKQLPVNVIDASGQPLKWQYTLNWGAKPVFTVIEVKGDTLITEWTRPDYPGYSGRNTYIRIR